MVHLQQPSIDEGPGEQFQADQKMMARALELAAQGVGLVSPGPLVGCVIVDKDGAIAGEGYYRFEDIKHAETLALCQAGDRARGGTAYVSLEPHAHHGRTSPCTDALIQAGITRVVAPIEDANPEVSGKGFAHLRASGVVVNTGLLSQAAERLNEKYLHFMRTGRPFVHLKIAASLDGKIATRTGDSRWITGAEARARVHAMRHECDAILVGAGTVLADDPLLTDRSELPRRKALIRVILDRRLELSTQARVVRTAKETPLLVFTGGGAEETGKEASLVSSGVLLLRNESNLDDLEFVLDELGRRSIQSVLVEGGATVAGRFLDAGLVNKVTFFLAPIIIGGGDAPTAVTSKGVGMLRDATRLVDIQVTRWGADLEITGYPSAKGNATVTG